MGQAKLALQGLIHPQELMSTRKMQATRGKPGFTQLEYGQGMRVDGVSKRSRQHGGRV